MDNEILVRASKVRRDKKILKIIKLALLIFVLLLIIAYIIVSFVYNNGNFSVSLDRNLYTKNKLIIYDDPNYKVFRTELYAKTVDYFDNISYKWLPNDLHDHVGGSHNGENYIAYTFYIENTGEDKVEYYTEIIIDDVIKEVDEAIRVRVYKEKTENTYAKISKDGGPEKMTVPFESETLITKDKVKDFKPGDIIKYTIVVWLEGSDPDCNDNILGGEIKMHMQFNSEFVEK